MYGFIIIFLIGLSFLAYGAYVLRRHSMAKHWPTVDGKLTALEYGFVFEPGRYTNVHFCYPKPTFEYQIEAVIYTGNTVNQDTKSTWVAIENQNDQTDFYCNVGDPLKVHYNPRNPAKSVLQTSLSPKRKSHFLAICVSGILLMAISIHLTIWLY